MAAELIYSSFTPIQTVVISRKDSKVKEEYENLGYNIEEMSNDFYYFSKPPKLEMVFRDGDKDYVFDMHDEFVKYYNAWDINNLKYFIHLVKEFTYKIIIGKLRVSISSDGSYTLNEL